MSDITIYSKENCPYCRMAKELLTARKLTFNEIKIDTDEAKYEEMIQLSHRRTVPQIFIKGQHIGGYDDLVGLVKSGKLDTLLKTEKDTL